MTRKSKTAAHAAPQAAGPIPLDDAELELIQGGGALLLPAVQAARESARSSTQNSTAKNNLEQIGLSIH